MIRCSVAVAIAAAWLVFVALSVGVVDDALVVVGGCLSSLSLSSSPSLSPLPSFDCFVDNLDFIYFFLWGLGFYLRSRSSFRNSLLSHTTYVAATSSPSWAQIVFMTLSVVSLYFVVFRVFYFIFVWLSPPIVCSSHFLIYWVWLLALLPHFISSLLPFTFCFLLFSHSYSHSLSLSLSYTPQHFFKFF